MTAATALSRPRNHSQEPMKSVPTTPPPVRATTGRTDWPASLDTAEKWAKAAPHLSPKECDSLAAKERDRIERDAGRYAELIKMCREAGLSEIVTAATQAAEHAFSFDGFIELALSGLKGVDPEKAWEVSLADYTSAKLTVAQLSYEVDAASEQLLSAAPYPADIAKRLGDELSAQLIMSKESIPLGERLELARRVHEWREQAIATSKALGIDDLDEQASDAHAAADDALCELVNTPAPDLAALTEKVRLWLARVHCDFAGDNIDDPEVMARLVNDAHLDRSWGPARFYQDLLRLTGQRPELLDPAPFDPAGWISDFEANPGHHITGGSPSYTHEAFGEPSPYALLVVDEAAIARFWSASDAVHGGKEHYAERRERSIGQPVSVQSQDEIRWFYPDGGDEADRLNQAWNEKQESQRATPVGYGMWTSLPRWKRDLIRELSIERSDVVREAVPTGALASQFLSAVATYNGAAHVIGGEVAISAQDEASANDRLYLNQLRWRIRRDNDFQLAKAVVARLSAS